MGGHDNTSYQQVIREATETSLLACGKCRAPVRVLANPGGQYEGPWDAYFEIQCANPECGNLVYIEFPTQQAVTYKRAQSLAPRVELERDDR